MRVNVYAEEITDRTEIVEKRPANHPDETFYGVRMYLESPYVLHKDPTDDDSSAITFWVPWTRQGGHDIGIVRATLMELVGHLDSLVSLGKAKDASIPRP